MGVGKGIQLGGKAVVIYIAGEMAAAITIKATTGLLDEMGAPKWLQGLTSLAAGILISKKVEGFMSTGVRSLDDIVKVGLGNIDDIKQFGIKNVDELIDIGVKNVDDLLKAGVKNSDDLLKLGVKNLDDLAKLDIKNSDGVFDAIKGASGAKNSVDDIITDGSHYVDGKLKPNSTYKTGEHDYIYKTDTDGLITNAQTDSLKLKTHDGRLNHNPNTPGKLDGDHAGHLFGDRFGGSPELDNLVTQAQNVNLSEYKVIENQWAKALENGKDVSNVNIDVHYVKGTSRPSSFDISYEIDGVPYFQTIEQ